MEDFECLEIYQMFKFPIVCVYENTLDYPGKFVARIWECVPEPKKTEYMVAKDTLEEIHAIIPFGMTRLKRYPNDDPVIVETWI